jgi:putative addiction module component (TIGR02574 family)
MNIQKLSASERILLAQELWDSVHDAANDVVVTKEQQAVLEQRLSALSSDGNPGDTWENVKRRITRA